jgi:hypothetical protein
VGGMDDKQDELPVHHRHLVGEGDGKGGVDDKQDELPVHHRHLVGEGEGKGGMDDKQAQTETVVAVVDQPAIETQL